MLFRTDALSTSASYVMYMYKLLSLKLFHKVLFVKGLSNNKLIFKLKIYKIFVTS